MAYLVYLVYRYYETMTPRLTTAALSTVVFLWLLPCLCTSQQQGSNTAGEAAVDDSADFLCNITQWGGPAGPGKECVFPFRYNGKVSPPSPTSTSCARPPFPTLSSRSTCARRWARATPAPGAPPTWIPPAPSPTAAAGGATATRGAPSWTTCCAGWTAPPRGPASEGPGRGGPPPSRQVQFGSQQLHLADKSSYMFFATYLRRIHSEPFYVSEAQDHLDGAASVVHGGQSGLVVGQLVRRRRKK